jgi:serine-type D-Ala-D-Ala carboxypeptidase (penicillin-binding protein 5/6)
MKLKLSAILLLIVFLGSFVLVKSSDLFAEPGLASPVLGISKSQISANAWFPKYDVRMDGGFSDAPEITARAAFFIDTATGEVLYSKNAQEKYSIASLTKIMTTIIALEHKKLDDIYPISQRVTEIEPDEMVLLPGEKHTLRNLLDGIFLVSANDAAEAISEGTVGSRAEFISLMNDKSAQIGMNNTVFVNPTGLEEDPEDCNGRSPCQYSTALDVALMSRYLIKTWPEVVNIASQQYVFIEKTADHQDYEMYSGINLLTSYPGVLGLKTGFTPEAGLTLVTLARQEGREVIGVLLGSVNRRDDAKIMLDYAFSKLNK